MTITELIAKLSEIREAEGDIDVVAWGESGGYMRPPSPDMIEVNIEDDAYGCTYSKVFDGTKIADAKVVQL